MNKLKLCDRFPPNSESCPDLTKQFTNLSQPLYLRKKGKRYISQLRNLKLHMSEERAILSPEESYASSESTVPLPCEGEEARKQGN